MAVTLVSLHFSIMQNHSTLKIGYYKKEWMIDNRKRKMTGESIRPQSSSDRRNSPLSYWCYFFFGFSVAFASFFAPAFFAGGFFVVGFLLPISLHLSDIDYNLILSQVIKTDRW